MHLNRLLITTAMMFVVLVLLAPFSAPPAVYAATTVTVSAAAMNGWYFYDDGLPGAVANFVTGPGTSPLGTGSVHILIPGINTKQNLSTPNYAGTRFGAITRLEYSTYRSSADPGNNLAITLQFDFDDNLNDADTSWKGRLVFEPYLTPGVGGTITSGAWRSWSPLTGKWYASRTPFNSLCSMVAPCTWAQVLINWPNSGVRQTVGVTHLSTGSSGTTGWAGFDGAADALTIGVSGNDTTFDFEPSPSAGLYFSPSAAAIPVGGTATFALNVASITNLYGYQFSTTHTANASTAATFYDGFFTTVAPAFIPGGWNKDCASGTACKFAVSHVDPQTPRTGSGMLATVSYTGLTPGTVSLAFSGDILSDKDANSLPHTTTGATLVVYGYGTVYGMVNLQGRATPLDATGTVTLTDASGFFPPVVATYGPVTGNFTVTVPAQAGGTTYNLSANHSLYLRNTLTGGGAPSVTPGGTANVAPTMLKGGDATNDGVIELGDLSCIGGAFGGLPTDCSGQGSSDINADGIVNILDLVLAGGNYNLTSPQPW